MGLLSAPRLNESGFFPTHHTYNQRFGTLTAAYERIGYKQTDTFRYTHASNGIRILHRRLICELLCIRFRLGQPLTFDVKRQVLKIFGRLSVSIAVLQWLAPRGRLRAGWALHLNNLQPCDAILIARMDPANVAILDCHLVPRSKFLGPRFRFTDVNMRRFRRFRLASLSAIVRLARGVK